MTQSRPNQTRAIRPGQRTGAMLVLIVIMLVGFLVALTFSVDVAQMHLTRTELRSSTDAASKAAALELSITQDQNMAVKRAQEIAALNQVNAEPLIVQASDIDFGRSVETAVGRYDFSQGSEPINSVRVQGKRTKGSASGPIPLFFGNLLGVSFFEPQTHATATYIERDVVLVVDRSGSMSGQKIADLQDAIDVFVETLNDTSVEERVGLASYNDQASQDVSLTENLAQVQSAMASMRARGYTSISRGMDAGHQIMQHSRDSQFVERTMIVMTDGRHNRGPEPRVSARQLAAEKVTIHTITFGNGADRSRMREVATIGGGNHYHAASGARLREIYREIALTLSTIITE